MRDRRRREGTHVEDGKIILGDIDGTNISHDNVNLTVIVDAIHKTQANDHRLYACIGHFEVKTQPYILDIGLDGTIGLDG